MCFAFIVSESGKKEIKKTYKKKTWTTADQKQELRTCGEFNATGSRANESGNYKSILFRFWPFLSYLTLVVVSYIARGLAANFSTSLKKKLEVALKRKVIWIYFLFEKKLIWNVEFNSQFRFTYSFTKLTETNGVWQSSCKFILGVLRTPSSHLIRAASCEHALISKCWEKAFWKSRIMQGFEHGNSCSFLMIQTKFLQCQ